MALINCPECKNQVSNTAASCPHCGAPILNTKLEKNDDDALTTVQETSKRLKLQTLYASLVAGLGAVLFILAIAFTGYAGKETYIGTGVFVIGFIWLIVTKLEVWWQHE